MINTRDETLTTFLDDFKHPANIYTNIKVLIHILKTGVAFLLDELFSLTALHPEINY